ncbi:hypothetical protein L2E82_00620 [Cichorium intybus]|uniref:Uncharacterized protein n=1 Tax=Cichorium intybus TaxID=13427 RepID=A0ACB9GWZ8_CICIN|nr:hypothetical protein L2E82_00620 [Cichorium intybus]
MSGMKFGTFSAAMVGEGASESTADSQGQVLSNSDYNVLPTGYKLNGQNYNLWAHSISIFIGGKGKEDYLSNSLVQPDSKTPAYKKWKTENNMFMSWLLNTMIPDIGEQFMFYKTAQEIWEAARDTFSNQDNTSALFEIKGILNDLRQGDLSVTTYFTTLNRFWQQPDVLDTLSWSCPADGKQYKKIQETDRIYKFLLGLNQELDEVRGRILGTKPMPSLREVFSEVRREESRRRVMLGSNSNGSTEGSAFVTRTPSNQKTTGGNNFGNNQKKNGRPWCDHCKKPGHTKDTCWKIHGKPTDWKPSPRGNVAEQQEPFTKEQVEAIRRALQAIPSENNGTATVAQQCGDSSAFISSSGGKPWVVDCGATDHMTGDKSFFSNLQPVQNGRTIRVATGNDAHVAGIGTVVLSNNITLRYVLYVPTLDYNLLSPIKLMKDLDCITVLTPTICVFQALSSGKMIGSAKVQGELYHCEADNKSNHQALSSLADVSSSNKIMLWHNRLGHPNFMYLKKLFPDLFNKNVRNLECEVCQLAKHTRSSYSPVPYKPSSPFHLIHSDVWGPSRVKNISGARWFVTFIDDHTQVTWVFLMKEKSEVGRIFQFFHKMVLTQFSTQIQILKSDNGVAERKNRHLLEVTRSLMFANSVPNFLWGEAVITVAYLVNRMPSRILSFQTPHTILHSAFPNSRYISNISPKVFGCTAFVHNNANNRSKLDPSSPEIPEAPEKEFQVYTRREKRPVVEQVTDAATVQESTSDKQGNSETHTPSESSESPESSASNDLDVPIALRKGKRNCTAHLIGNFVSYENLSPKYKSFALSLSETQVPRTIQEAKSKKEWADAVTEELNALQEKNTWSYTKLPPGKRAVGSKWVFTVKYNSDGSVNRYKARLVAKGFTQSYGIDYAETFAPVAKLNSIRVLLSLAANLDWPLHQLDVKNAFLNRELQEDVYMEIPPGLETMENKGLVAIMIVYVDDIIITGSFDKQIHELKGLLSKEFKIKDLGQLKYFLGMEIARSKNGISVSQRKYTLDLLSETGMLGCKPASIPLDPGKKFQAHRDPVDKERYQRLVGKLIYLAHTRPDIGFAVGMVSRFMNSPTSQHMDSVFQILRYLKGNPGRGLL